MRVKPLHEWPNPLRVQQPSKLNIYLRLELDSIQRPGSFLRTVVENEDGRLHQEGDIVDSRVRYHPPIYESLYVETRQQLLSTGSQRQILTAPPTDGLNTFVIPKMLKVMLQEDERRKCIVRDLPAVHHRIYHEVLQEIASRNGPFLLKLCRPTGKQSPKYERPCLSLAVRSARATSLRADICKALEKRMEVQQKGLWRRTRNVSAEAFHPHIYLHKHLTNDPLTRIQDVVDFMATGAITMKVTALLLRSMHMSDGIDQADPEGIFELVGP